MSERQATTIARSGRVSQPVASIGSHFMLAFEGYEVPAYMQRWIADRPVAGFTLFRALNVQEPAQVQRLTAHLQQLVHSAGHLPADGVALIAADEEGGQLLALGPGTTPFPGNMALGATRDGELARQVGLAAGQELAAMGVNVNYAPVCDVNSNPQNPNVGVRAFGDDPQLVAGLGAAMIQGLQEAGVAATAKHFPGNGDSGVDPHFGVPSLPHTRQQLENGAFKPFRAAVDAGVRMIMSAHIALPELTGSPDVPATLQREIMDDLLRRELGFEGLLISDAMDMKAISQGAGQIVDAVAALRAGIDVLLLTAGAETQERLYQGLQLALSRRLFSENRLRRARSRIGGLQQWLAKQPQPPLDVVACRAHRRLAQRVAEQSLTLVRDDQQLLPLHLDTAGHVAVIMPRPADLTPADTSSTIKPCLAAALRAFLPRVDEFITANPPRDSEIAALKEQLADYDLLILVTLSASMQPAQAAMARELLSLDIPTITVAARTPYDLAVYPQARTHVCTYSIQPPSFQALAAALIGRIPMPGRLPVTIPGLYEFGHGLG